MPEIVYSPSVWVRPIESIRSADLAEVSSAFFRADPIPLVQRYPGGDFAALPTGFARLGLSGTTLHILAELNDDDIVTRAKGLNEPVFLLGDCFEIFLKIEAFPQYLEFHVGPNNATLQLLYPSSEQFRRHRGGPIEKFIERFRIKEPAFFSRVWCHGEYNRWTVLAAIDLRILDAEISFVHRQSLQYSFCRYDYGRTRTAPILSSTSVMRKLDFHQIEDWGTLCIFDDALVSSVT